MNRVQAIRYGWIGVAMILGLRLVDLQALHQGYWNTRGENLRAWNEIVPARRGRILDRRGVALADNQPWVSQPGAKKTSSPPLIIERELTPALQARLAEREESGATPPRIYAQRVYPEVQQGCHVVGYAREAHAFTGDWRGRDGLELMLDRRLRGQDGSRTWLVTAAGKRLRLLDQKPPVAGDDIKTSLDLELQRRARKYLQSVLKQLGSVRPASDQPAGSVVVLDPQSGQILTMVSMPDFDPGDFTLPGRSRSLSSLLSDPHAPLLNRAVAGQYPAASTFKIVTATGALHAGLIGPQRNFHCAGAVLVDGIPFHCFVRRGHGTLHFEQALAVSCDCVFYELGLQLGPDRLRNWAQRWGVGRLTGSQLPGESAGWLPDGKLPAGETANLSIGQGSLLVTPLQMARIAAGVSNRGKLPRPTFLLDPNPPQSGLTVDLPAPMWDRLQRGLEGVVDHGTAAGLAPRGLRFAGKTGTVENSPSSSNPRGYNHTWFVAYGPLGSAHPVALAVFLERSGGYGGALAAPIAARLMADVEQLGRQTFEENSKQR